MIAKAWQAWLAAIVVIVGMLMLLVLREVGGDEREGFGGPRRTYDYDAPRAALLDQLLGDRLRPRYIVARKDGWEPYRPGSDLDVQLPALDPADDDPPPPPPEHEDTTVRVTADALAIDGGDPVPDEDALARLTIMARVDPAMTVELAVDADLPYQRIVHVMDAIKAAGVENLALTATP